MTSTAHFGLPHNFLAPSQIRSRLLKNRSFAPPLLHFSFTWPTIRADATKRQFRSHDRRKIASQFRQLSRTAADALATRKAFRLAGCPHWFVTRKSHIVNVPASSARPRALNPETLSHFRPLSNRRPPISLLILILILVRRLPFVSFVLFCGRFPSLFPPFPPVQSVRFLVSWCLGGSSMCDLKLAATGRLC